jgi:hypothetical protein
MRIASFFVLLLTILTVNGAGPNITVKANSTKSGTTNAGMMVIDSYKSVPGGSYTVPNGENLNNWDILINRGLLNAQGAFQPDSSPGNVPKSDTIPNLYLDKLSFGAGTALAANWSTVGFSYTFDLYNPLPNGTPTKYVRAQLRKQVAGFMMPQATAMDAMW